MYMLILGAAAVVTLVLALAVSAKRKTGNREPRTAHSPRKLEPKVVEIHDQPDEPTGFGPKSLWIVVRALDPQVVAEALHLHDQKVSNWESGLTAAEAYPSDHVFVTPPINGWVVAVGVGLPDPSDPKLLPRWRSLMVAVSHRFGDAWFFGTHRVSSYSVWAKYSAGNERRLFAHAEGVQVYNFGEPLDEEADVIECRQGGSDAQGREDEGHREPDEDDVLQLAGLWTIDPSALDSLDLPPSVGIVGKLPPEFELGELANL